VVVGIRSENPFFLLPGFDLFFGRDFAVVARLVLFFGNNSYALANDLAALVI